MKTGPELIAEIAQFPTIDVVLDRNPLSKPLSDDELDQQIERMRLERTLFHVKEQETRDKKRGQEKLEPTEEKTDDSNQG